MLRALVAWSLSYRLLVLALALADVDTALALALPLTTRMHLTWVDAEVEGADVFFPRFDAARWREVSRERHPADAAHAFAFEFVDYVLSDGGRD